MTLLDRYFLRKLAAAVVSTMTALVLLFLVVDLLTHRQDNIVEYGIPWLVVGEYYVSLVPTILLEFHFLPMAILIGTVVVFGRAAERNEITAMLASGVSVYRIARLPLLVAAGVSLGAYWFGEWVGVPSNVSVARIEERYFSKSVGDTREGVSWLNLENGWMCHLAKYNREAATGEGVVMHRFAAVGNEEIRARRIFWVEEEGRWYLEDGVWLRDSGDGGQTSERITQVAVPFRESPAALFAFDVEPNLLDHGGLVAALARGGAGRARSRFALERAMRFARPALCFVMLWIAIPFAVRQRTGGFVGGIGIALAIGLGYMLCFYGSVGLGRVGAVSPVVAAWLANGVFAALGTILFLRVRT